jgi:hypothetical protein
MTKRSTNFNGQRRYRNLGASDLIATYRMLGMSEEEIKAQMLKLRSCKTCGEVGDLCHCQPAPNNPLNTDGGESAQGESQ